MSKIKIAFSGIGGVGGYYGGRMAAHYADSEQVDIYFIGRGENLKAIQDKGLTLRIEAEQRTLSVHPRLATDQPAAVGPVDYLFCCTKGYDLEANVRQLQPLIGQETVVIPLLNGLGIPERIQALCPGRTIWGGCVYIGARLIAPGTVTLFSKKERFFFGGETLRHRQTALWKLLTDAGINAFNTDDIQQRIWKKFYMISTAATTTSYFDQPLNEVIAQHHDDFIAISEELAAVARAAHAGLPNDIVESSLEAQQMMPPGSTTSMHTDFKNGKPTELESLTGYVIRLGERFGIATPTYRRMYEKLRLL